MQLIYIVRHGETDWNKFRKYQGQTDVPMNEAGRSQAAALAEKLRGVLPFDRVVASDLSRAVETARIICGGFDIPIHTDKGFREIDFGQWEGLDMKAIEERWPGRLQEWFTNGRLNVPGGETEEQLFERVWGSFRHWADMTDYQKMAIVCHGGTSGVLISSVKGRPLHEMSRYMLKNMGVCVVAVEGPGRYAIEEMGELLR
ncbi:MAG: histidine phosphatase family protein [Clostridiales bacterium]|nr:histidine phosphatase family protein [Clostridiales bacterium]